MDGTVDDLTRPADPGGSHATVATPSGELADDGSTRLDDQPAWSSRLHGPWRVAVVVAVAGAVAAGLVLRFWTRSALWLDEALTVDIARLPLHELPAYLRRDGAPPLYYALLHFWMGAFGSGRVAVRALSGVLSVATLPVAWMAARRFAGRSVAWILVAVLATPGPGDTLERYARVAEQSPPERIQSDT